jgi:alpha-beta hydrolase superfamily lysophospholipase
MKHEEYYLLSGGRSLFAQSWQPDGKMRGVVGLVHGYGEHTARYAYVAERFVEAGYTFAGVDMPGHGRTKGVLGHASFAGILGAIGDHITEIRRRNPGLPIILLGFSLGGAMVLRFAIEQKPAIAGVIASSPLISPAFRPPVWKVTLVRLMRSFFPWIVLNNPLDLANLSRDSSVIDAVHKDPYYHNKASFQFGWDLIHCGDWFTSVQGVFPLPLLIMQGTADRIVDAKATINFAGRLTGDITLKTWDGYYHELHNEPEKDAVIGLMVAWADAHI